MDPKEIKGEHLNGVYSEIASILGIDVALKLHSTYRGQQVTFPVNLFSKDFIRQQIIKEYDGCNVKQLASRYGYTEKWIKKILKEHNDSENK